MKLLSVHIHVSVASDGLTPEQVSPSGKFLDHSFQEELKKVIKDAVIAGESYVNFPDVVEQSPEEDGDWWLVVG